MIRYPYFYLSYTFTRLAFLSSRDACLITTCKPFCPRFLHCSTAGVPFVTRVLIGAIAPTYKVVD